MVRFKETALVIEIPCEAGDAVGFYSSLQNALLDVFWNATAKGQNEPGNGANWMAAYLGPALAELEPNAKQVLSQLAHGKEENRPLCAESHSNEEILALMKDLPMSRFMQIMSHFDQRVVAVAE